jgi:signal transduction histidine kinase
VAVAASSRTDPTDLTGVAATSHRALASDAVVILLLDADGPPLIVASEGLTEGQRTRLVGPLSAVSARLAPWGSIVIDATSAGSLEDPALGVTLVQQGFVGAVGAASPLDSGGLAAVVALRRESGDFENPELIEVFAAQAATALDQPSRRARLRATSDGLEEGLAAVEQLVLAGTSLEALNSALTEAIGPLFGVTSLGVMAWDERRQSLRLLPGAFGADEQAVNSCQISAADFRSNSARVFSTGRGYFSNDVRSGPAFFREFVDLFALERVLSVPLILAGRAIGVLHLANKRQDFTPEDLDRAEALAPKVGTVVEIAQTHVRLRSQRRLEEVLADVAVALASGVPVRDFLVTAFTEVGRAADASLLALVPNADAPIVWRRGDARPEIERLVLAEADSQPGVRAYVVGPRAPRDAGWATFHVPMHLGAQRVGTLVALRARAEPFAQEERDAIARLANLAALGRATERYQQQRAELARLHERQRLADGLHDDVAQLLFAAQLSLDVALEREGVDPGVADGVSQTRALLVRADTAIRTVINRLASPPQPDLALRLAAAVADVENAFGQPIHLTISSSAAAASKRLRRPSGDALVQVARHATMAAARRGAPRRISVALSHAAPDCLVLTVEDDGVGELRRDTRDLTPLRQRITDAGGSLRVRHEPAAGSVVTVSLPA